MIIIDDGDGDGGGGGGEVHVDDQCFHRGAFVFVCVCVCDMMMIGGAANPCASAGCGFAVCSWCCDDSYVCGDCPRGYTGTAPCTGGVALQGG